MKTTLIALRMFFFMTLITGVVYPLFITLIGGVIFTEKANGGFITKDSKLIGAHLIGQKFTSDRYFFSRPSAIDYNPLHSGGSNLGPTSLTLRNQVKERIQKLEEEIGSNNVLLPSELLFASGSGLDPHISKDAAYFQVNRILKARNQDSKEGSKKIKELIDSSSQYFLMSHLSRPYVNVLLLNVSLDNLFDNQK